MAESPGQSGDLPFKEPVDAAELNLGLGPIEAEEVQNVEKKIWRKDTIFFQV